MDFSKTVLIRSADAHAKTKQLFAQHMDLTIPDNIKFCNRIDESAVYKYYNRNTRTILGSIIVSSGKGEYDLLEFVSSLVSGFNIADRMIRKYKQQFKRDLVPYEFVADSSSYWVHQYLKNGVNSYEELVAHTEHKYNLCVESDLKWDILKAEFALCNDYINHFGKYDAAKYRKASEMYKYLGTQMLNTKVDLS